MSLNVLSLLGLSLVIRIICRDFEFHTALLFFLLESELKKLMVEIQNNFKCLGLLEPYSWRKEEACVVRGSDSLWYRGKVVEHGGGTLQVSLIVCLMWVGVNTDMFISCVCK